MSTSLEDIRVIYLGCGHMGSALVRASIASGALSAHQYILVDHHPDRLIDLVQQGAVVLTDIQQVTEALASFEPAAKTLIVLGTKPQTLPQLLPTIPQALLHSASVLSLAVGVRLETLASLLPASTCLARLMPNLGAQVCSSASSLCTMPNTSDEDQALLISYASSFGSVYCMTEEEMDVSGVVAGSSPALFATVVHELATSASAHGLDYQTAVLLATQTMESTARILAQGADPQGFVRQVCSPQGTTEAGLAAGNQALHTGVERFVCGALQRTHELRNGAQ